ncbi:MAG TPA: immunoglobulin domain-containing protein [Verrucomicrobiae bacterium]
MIIVETIIFSHSTHCGGWRWPALLLATGLAWAGLTSAQGAGLQFMDNFADRQTTMNVSGQLDGDNTNATVELNEPRHGGKPGGHSVWVSWKAPGDGVARFSTDGSMFDTLLSAYYFSQPADTTLDKLKEAARNDDESPLAAPASLIQFGARAGVVYHIAVDGYFGATGNIRLRWDFVNVTSPPPIIVSVPGDQAVRQGDTVTLTVDLQATPGLDLQWRYNDNSIGTAGPTLVITNFQAINAGSYTLRVRIGSVRFELVPTELQINSDGQTNALARDKLMDAAGSPLIGSDGSGGGGNGGGGGGSGLLFRSASLAAGGVVRGFNGSQIFDTTFATTDPNEPLHCGVASDASYWLAYQPPTNGTVTLDTIGSTYDTLLAVYTYDPPLTSYAGLIPITCDNDWTGPLGAARVEFAAVKDRTYAVVVASVNGARGIAQLNYLLDPSRPPLPLTLMMAPVSQTVEVGTAVTLSLSVTGSPPLRFTWSKDSLPLTNVQSSWFSLPSAAPSDSANYFVTVRNYVGPPLMATLPLRVVGPRIVLTPDPNSMMLNFPTVAGQRYFVEETTALGGAWQPWPNSVFGDGTAVMLQITNQFEPGARFFRIRVE